MKVFMFQNQDLKVQNVFYPLFNNENQIVGTQCLQSDLRIELQNFNEDDFQFSTEIAQSGYKNYFAKE